MGDLSLTSTPSMSDLSTSPNDEETDSSSPMKLTEESTVTVKPTGTTSLSAPLPLWEATPLVQSSWSKVLQDLPAPEGRNSFAL